MTTTSPERAVLDALATYLKSSITAQPDLSQSEVYSEWPEPTTTMELGPNRIVVSVIRGGVPERRTRLGPPQLSRVIPGAPPAAVFRFEDDQIDQPITIGTWAISSALRDDVDYLIEGFLNAAFWTTVSPIGSTTLSEDVVAGATTLVPVSAADIGPGSTLLVDGSTARAETVVVNVLRPSLELDLTRACRFPHIAGATVVEVAGRNVTAESGLHLRCPLHFNAIARYDFDSPSTLDSPDNAQMQQWRSIRQGKGSIRRFLEVPGVMQLRASVVAL